MKLSGPVAVVAFSCLIATAAGEFRSIDGSGNNIANPLWGSTGIQFQRWELSHYSDGASGMAGGSRPSSREVSNAVCAQSASTVNARGLSDFVWQWGQFLDHDLDLTPSADPIESAPITVPIGDPHFDPLNTGNVTIPFSRSIYDPATGTTSPREQLNTITAWIDASNVYGSDAQRAAALRTGTNGLLKTSAGNLMPFNVDNLHNENGPGGAADAMNMFLAGDVRANEQIGLLAMHTLFVREHNRLAALFQASNSSLSDEEIYQLARTVVAAEMQLITFNEFLPALLGDDPLEPYTGYNASVNGGITNEFSSASFRFGHSMVSASFMLMADDGSPVGPGSLNLRDAFFNPALAVQYGIGPFLKGLASHMMEEVDLKVIDDLRNFLFGPPGAGGLDLAALNIQRGRDHALCDFNSLREHFGLPKLQSFQDFPADPATQAALQGLYSSIDDIDIWVGTLAEEHAAGSSTGPTLKMSMKKMFTSLRDGDRFYYLNDPIFEDILAMIGLTVETFETEMRLGRIIEKNTAISELQTNVFFAPQSLSSMTIKSDPHIKGLHGQEFDFTGVDGKFYNLIRDVSSKYVKNHLIVNTALRQSYETMIFMNGKDQLQNFGPAKDKTWMSGLGITAGKSTAQILTESPIEAYGDLSQVSCPKNKCLDFGYVIHDQQQIRLLGPHTGIDMNLNLTLSNSKSFSRIKIEAPNLRMTADIVRPPSTWLIPEHDQDQYGHINIKIDYISLFSFNGILGETGRAAQTLEDQSVSNRGKLNGRSFLSHEDSYYQVSALLD